MPPNAARIITYAGESPKNATTTATATGIQTVFQVILAVFDMKITGTTMSATTAGRMPLNIFSTVGLSWMSVKTIAASRMIMKEGSAAPIAHASAPQNLAIL